MIEDAMTSDTAEDGGWMVAGVLTELEGAVLTTLAGEAGLAGTMVLDPVLRHAANDDRGEGAMP